MPISGFLDCAGTRVQLSRLFPVSSSTKRTAVTGCVVSSAHADRATSVMHSGSISRICFTIGPTAGDEGSQNATLMAGGAYSPCRGKGRRLPGGIARYSGGRIGHEPWRAPLGLRAEHNGIDALKLSRSFTSETIPPGHIRWRARAMGSKLHIRVNNANEGISNDEEDPCCRRREWNSA